MGVGCEEISLAAVIGAGSRTVERRRGDSCCGTTGEACAAAMSAGSAGGGASVGGASRSATASTKSASLAGPSVNSSADSAESNACCSSSPSFVRSYAVGAPSSRSRPKRLRRPPRRPRRRRRRSPSRCGSPPAEVSSPSAASSSEETASAPSAPNSSSVSPASSKRCCGLFDGGFISCDQKIVSFIGAAPRKLTSDAGRSTGYDRDWSVSGHTHFLCSASTLLTRAGTSRSSY